MNLKMFLEFPGILILIGVILLIIAIIIGVIAFKKVDENEMTNVVDRDITNDEQPEEIGTDMEEYENNIEEIKEEELPVIKDNIIEEATIEEDDKKEEESIIEEDNNNEEIIELKDESKDLITEEFDFEEQEEIKENKKEQDDDIELL